MAGQFQSKAPLVRLRDDDGVLDVVHAHPEVKPKIKKPRMFKVVLLNDDYTPMDFVVHILQRFFHLPRARADHLMLEIHTTGSGVCGVYSREIAETRVTNVNDYSRTRKHPLLCVMEPERPC